MVVILFVFAKVCNVRFSFHLPFQSLLSKMSRGSGGSGWISYKFWSIVLLALIGVIVNKDIVKHNGFKSEY